jgi:TetR/AcrR family fatty acid metabolism transcriptional regulator
LKKLTSRQQQAIETKRKIFTTSIRLIQENGLDNITIEQISKEVGVSVGAIYHYYKSKTDILFDIYLDADEYFEKTVQKTLSKKSSTDKLIGFFVCYAEYISERGYTFVRELFHYSNTNFIRKDRFMIIYLNDIIKNLQHRGVLSTEYTPDYINEYLFCVARGLIFNWCLQEGEFDIVARTKEYTMHSIQKFIL